MPFEGQAASCWAQNLSRRVQPVNPGGIARTIWVNRLEEILRVKRGEIERLRPRRDELHKAALLRNDFRGFAAALQGEPGKVALIAEIKKASPSAGVIA